ncbi:MAG: hypothetical protein JF586_11125 [Burkholderiales bacterium]|nr:hypothetical protein [Burkholderiales bacterium]
MRRDTRQALLQVSAMSGTSVAIVIAGGACAAAALAVWWQTPELHVQTGAHDAVAHMELLGEYPSDIRSITIARDGASAPVWRIMAVGDFFQIHSVRLTAGENPADALLFPGAARHVLPSSGAMYRLEAGIAYRITICPLATPGLCRHARFVLPSR